MTETNDNEPRESAPLRLDPPRLLNSLNIRVTFRPEPISDNDESSRALALASEISAEELLMVNVKIPRGTIELALTDGFGRQRTLMLTPAEFFYLMGQAQRFLQEFPTDA